MVQSTPKDVLHVVLGGVLGFTAGHYMSYVKTYLKPYAYQQTVERTVSTTTTPASPSAITPVDNHPTHQLVDGGSQCKDPKALALLEKMRHVRFWHSPISSKRYIMSGNFNIALYVPDRGNVGVGRAYPPPFILDLSKQIPNYSPICSRKIKARADDLGHLLVPVERTF